MALLEVTDLSVSFKTDDGVVQAVRDMTFALDVGQTLGIVGESGSGKSVSAQTIMGLTRGAQIGGSVRFDGRELLGLSPAQLRSVRGAGIGIIFQDPLSSLHPLYKVGWQIVEMIRAHESVSKAAARKRAIELLGLVGIPQPDRRVDDYPHQFSGGMRQRAMIAMSLALNPRLLIADEPTTALDVTIQAQILELIQRLQQEFHTALIMITHDLGVVAEIADQVLVMYAGRAVEQTDRAGIFGAPHHPYTKGLIRSIPAYSSERERLVPIAGSPPSLINLPPGCSFNPRCPEVMDKCLQERPALLPLNGRPEHRSACFLPDDETGVDSKRPDAPGARTSTPTNASRRRPPPSLRKESA